MIGIIIEAQCADEKFKNKIFHRLGDMCSLEMVMMACLRSAYAHKVTVSMPALDRAAIYGNIAKQGLVKKDMDVDGRKVGFVFHRAEHPLERLYYIARDQGLSTVVRVKADNPFLPTWLINEMICKHQERGGKEYMISNFGPGLHVEIIPFWVLANAHVYIDDKDEFYGYITSKFTPFIFKNEGDNYIHESCKGLKLESTDQLIMFERIAYEVQAGRDLGDLLKEIANDQS